MDSIEFKHLILDLKTTLNGDKLFFSSIRYLRYMSIIAFASLSLVFKEEAINKDGTLYFKIYTLEKIAKFLDLKFDKTRSARIVLDDAVSRGESQTILDNKGILYYSLTETGFTMCKTKLLDLNEVISSKYLPMAINASTEPLTMNYITSISQPTPSLHPEAQKLIDRMKSIERPLNII
jgi:hypothetical protein